MEPEVKVGIIASSVRPWLWPELLDSLEGNKIKPQITFAGNLDQFHVRPYLKRYPNLQYIHTAVKPAQCYQLAFLNTDFDSLILYVADDCEFEEGLIDKIVKFYYQQKNPKAVISVRTNENGRNYGTEVHTLIGWNVNTPLMAPIGLVSQRYIAELNGFDRRFISGQWENDFVMRVYADGGTVIPYDFNEDGTVGPTVKIDHEIKHGPGTKFWTAYEHDRIILENTWVKGSYKPTTPYVTITESSGRVTPMFKIIDNRKVLSKPQLPFEPYEDENLAIKNQGPSGKFALEGEA